MAGLQTLETTCGCGVATVRVTPRATTQRCVYWPGIGAPLSELLAVSQEITSTPAFVAARLLPQACEPFQFRETCRVGCAGRRAWQGALGQPDCYCPVIRNDRPLLRSEGGENS